MKRIILVMLLVAISATTTLAQTTKDYVYKGITNFPANTETGKVTYEGVIVAEGMNAQELYNAALLWLAKTHSNKGAIQSQQSNEFISGRATVKTGDDLTRYDYLLEFKDGKYRYVLNNFVVLWSAGGTAGASPLETFYPARAKGKNAMAQDQDMQARHQAIEAETQKLATIATKKEDW